MTEIHEQLHPAHWRRPKGYANGMAAAPGRMLFLAGQVGWNAELRIESDDFAAQVEQSLRNIATVLAEAGATPRHLVRLTWFVTDKREYLENLTRVGSAYLEVIGRHFPAMSLVQVTALVEDRAKVEIEATAVIP
ncbi:MAG: RidA family protein [Immundisolibacterales bacterium]|nr:RidA family protein [Immundisolibacterales bacterium]